jgi:hypothetical protein
MQPFYSPSPEYPVACCRDEWHGDPPKLEERRRVGFDEFRFDTPKLAAGSFIFARIPERKG